MTTGLQYQSNASAAGYGYILYNFAGPDQDGNVKYELPDDCCCDDTSTNTCNDCSPKITDGNLYVTVSGLVAPLDVYNGSFTLSWIAGCQWRYTFPAGDPWYESYLDLYWTLSTSLGITQGKYHWHLEYVFNRTDPEFNWCNACHFIHYDVPPDPEDDCTDPGDFVMAYGCRPRGLYIADCMPTGCVEADWYNHNPCDAFGNPRNALCDKSYRENATAVVT